MTQSLVSCVWFLPPNIWLQGSSMVLYVVLTHHIFTDSDSPPQQTSISFLSQTQHTSESSEPRAMYGLKARPTICLTCKQLQFSFLIRLPFGNSLTLAIKTGFQIKYFLPPFMGSHWSSSTSLGQFPYFARSSQRYEL